jgi:hypothetical protein
MAESGLKMEERGCRPVVKFSWREIDFRLGSMTANKEWCTGVRRYGRSLMLEDELI